MARFYFAFSNVFVYTLSFSIFLINFSRPNEKDLNEKTNYYQNVYLKKATENKGSFFVDVQGMLYL